MGGNEQENQTKETNSETPQFDYEGLANIIVEKQAATEDAALKNYFKQQGLSQEEMVQAITAFKQQKAKNTPDATFLQQQASQAQAALQKVQIENAAILAAMGLGIDAKTVPYIIRLADFTNAKTQDGKIDNNAIKTALDKVLEDVPSLKGNPETNTGFVKIGNPENSNQQNKDDALAEIFGNKK